MTGEPLLLTRDSLAEGTRVRHKRDPEPGRWMRRVGRVSLRRQRPQFRAVGFAQPSAPLVGGRGGRCVVEGLALRPAGGTGAFCLADANGDLTLDLNDVGAFAAILVSGTTCP